jgi:GT2 family glycosyltransferase/glycosyltransferase involved in cell wall biosynthesis
VKQRRVCLVATELHGLFKNGGIGTATTYLALALAGDGCEVEVLHCGHGTRMQPHWADVYDEAGVRVEHLDRSETVNPGFLADSYHVYTTLKDRELDLVVFQDWGGLGFCCMNAKAQQLAFRTTDLFHICHGPTPWLREANRSVVFGVDELASTHMERRSAELADVVVSPSAHLPAWMAARGWQLPEVAVVPYFTAEGVQELTGRQAMPAASRARTRSRHALTELVFFGRLEERKGVGLFLQALRRIEPRLLAGRRVTFLGKETTWTADRVVEVLGGDVVGALGELAFVTHLDQVGAVEYLRRPGVVAVIPSLLDNSPNVVYECLENGVSFLATDVGGVGELIEPEDRPRVLVPAEAPALATRLAELLNRGVIEAPPTPAYSAGASIAAWRRLLARPVPATPDTPATEAVAVREPPLVTVVVPHHDRPLLVRHCLDAIVAQDYGHLEIVLVDDGSEKAATHAALDELEWFPWSRPFRLVRQENRYLGAARNTGVAHAKGDLVLFLDDDNVADRRMVSTLVQVLERTGADAATCVLQMFQSEDGPARLGDDVGVWAFLGEAPEVGMVQNVFGDASGLYRKDALVALGGFHEQHGVGFEDWHLLARLVLSGRKLVTVPDPLVWYRVTPDSMVRTTSPYRNLRPVLEAYAALLPPELAPLPELVGGMHNLAAEAVGERARLRAENRALRRWAEMCEHERLRTPRTAAGRLTDRHSRTRIDR